MTDHALDCTRCGACCFGTHAKYIALLPEDRGRDIPADITTEADGRRYMAMAGGHCAQLCRDGDRLVCGIYENRPEACRAYRAGSFECSRARQHRLHLAEAMRLPIAIPGDGLDPPAPLVEPIAAAPETALPEAWALPPQGRFGRYEA
ncbi:YkgJ family cysteine cluster protein [Salipiger abyssi]|uniref:YkgJ family cysteine cluster protein n=1 Tax=Salipiger abyssi TaxID=1250539 RepID=UPI001A8FCD44|nr:YkgJ family cysteine cluster protein [Salipiger abyssi]MBN9886736.1 YkgJ family cysteine cluster protein [Salipiger abyssi]